MGGAEAGLITVRQTERDQQYPERTVYELTDEGRREGAQWLAEMLATPRNEFPEFSAALSFVMLLPPEQALAVLGQRATAVRADLDRIEAGLANYAATLPRVTMIEDEYQRAMLAAELGWLDGVLDDLRTGALTWSEESLAKLAGSKLAGSELAESRRRPASVSALRRWRPANAADLCVAGQVPDHLDDLGWPVALPPGGLAVWNPATGTLKIIFTAGAVVLDAMTAPGARSSLLAWQPDACLLRNCPIEITDTSSLMTVTVRSPLHHGFTTSGAAFSPDGTRLAVFARTAPVSSANPGISVLALASTSTGRVRTVPGVRLDTPEDAAWALWRPGGNRLLAGALQGSFAVDTTTSAARPFFFFPALSDHDIMNTPDVNFSAALLPALRRLP